MNFARLRLKMRLVKALVLVYTRRNPYRQIHLEIDLHYQGPYYVTFRKSYDIASFVSFKELTTS